MENIVNTVDAKHIFIDIVNYTYNRSVEAQADLISYLNQYVLETLYEKEIKDEDKIFIPTGDGMCISLINIFSSYDIHIQIALGILEKIHTHNNQIKDEMRKFNIRIGINENIDNLIIDINKNKNISGSGINMASRIEGLCDSNQIIVGNSVFEKLTQREKYMKSFVSYYTEVKHGLRLNVHQYINANFDFLNSETPSKFRATPKKMLKLDKIQAYYLANCIKHEDFINKNLDRGQHSYSLQLQFIQLAEDCLGESNATKLNPNYIKKIENRTLQEHFDYLQSIDFWIVVDLLNFNINNHIQSISNLFSEPFLFVNDHGKRKLLEDFPEISAEFQKTSIRTIS